MSPHGASPDVYPFARSRRVRGVRVALLLVAAQVLLVLGCAGKSGGRVHPGGGGAPSGTGGAPGTGSAPPGGGEGGAGAALRGGCTDATRRGWFGVQTDEAMPAATFDGSVKDGTDPNRIPEDLATVGDCRLVRYPRYVCAPACSSGNTCGPDGTCWAMARALDAGVLTVAGLAPPADDPLALEPLQPGNVYFASLGLPPVTPGARVTLTASTGLLGGLELVGFGVEPLELAGGTLELTAGNAATLRWEPPAAPGGARVSLSLSVDQHGTSPVRLLCDVPDTGEYAIDPELVDALLAAGVTGFPSALVARHTLDSTAAAGGCVELEVTSYRSPAVTIPGYTPCTIQGDCPNGLICNTALQRCE